MNLTSSARAAGALTCEVLIPPTQEHSSLVPLVAVEVEAEAICAGLVEGLYRARSVNSDGALGWAPDFPIEQADQVLQEFFRSSAPAAKLAGWKSMLEILAARTPEWTDMLRRAADPSGKG